MLRADALLIVLGGLLGACSPSGTGRPAISAADDHFTCAALISAADHLMTAGMAPVDPVVRERGLVAAMTHLNAWAIPQGLAEREAFNRVNADRDRLRASLSPAEIVARARACISSV